MRGGTSQPAQFDIFADIINNHCIYAWRELAWNVNVDLAAHVAQWATQASTARRPRRRW